MEKRNVKVTMETLEAALTAADKAVQAGPKITFKEQYWWGRSVKQLGKTYNLLSEKKNELLMKYGKKDDKGQIQLGPRGVIVDPAKMEDWNREYKELTEIEESAEVYLVPFESLSECKLNPVELASLVGLLCTEPDEPTLTGGNA